MSSDPHIRVSSDDSDPASGARAPALVTSVVRTADLLSYLAQSPTGQVGVTEAAAALGLSKAVIYRILISLQDRGYVELDEQTHRYRLGAKSLSLGMAYLERTDVRVLGRSALVELSKRASETATLSVRSGRQRLYIDQVTPDRDIKMVVPIGRPFPLHAGSSSKAFLAFLPPEERERYLSEQPLEALTPRTLVDRSALRAELERIRLTGFAVSHGERQDGAGSVAAPLLDHRSLPVAVLSICGPIERFRPRSTELARILVTETRRLSSQLGFSER